MTLINLAETTWKKIIAGIALAASAFLLFWNLGHYSLWADESLTALSAKAVLATGDTSAWVGNDNLVAYANGVELNNMHIRSMPPVPAYMTAASFALFGVNTWAARFPFALAGLLAVLLMLWWARGASLQYFAILAMGIAGNVSLFLYLRNCRYYAPTVLFSALTVYCYFTWRGGKGRLIMMALASLLLLATQYMAFLAVYVCIALDYLFWRRKEARLALADWLALLLPQAVLGGIIAWIWNPLRVGYGGRMSSNSLWDRLVIFYWNLRDANAVEFFVLPLILAGFVVALRAKLDIAKPLRASVAMLVAMFIIVFFTLQSRAATSVADVRYIVFLIPLGIALGAWAVCAILPNRMALSLLLAAVAFFSNILNGGMYFTWSGGARSTTYSYVRELLYPTNTDPCKETARWMKENIAPGKTVLVESMINDLYPLMFHAPHVIYAWQFNDRSNPQFASLPAIHFKGEVMPDYLIGFGPQVGQLRNDLNRYSQKGTEYRMATKLDVFWKDLYRPELFWRTFTPITNYNKDVDVVFIFQKVGAPAK